MIKTGHDKLLHLYSFFTETVLMCESLSAGEGGDEMRLMSCGHGLKFSSLLISSGAGVSSVHINMIYHYDIIIIDI